MQVLRVNNAATAAERRAQLIVQRERKDVMRLAGGFVARSGHSIRDGESLPRVGLSQSGGPLSGPDCFVAIYLGA